MFFTNKFIYFIWLTPLRYISPWPLSALLRLINGTKRLLSNHQLPDRVLYCNTRNSRSYSQKVKLNTLSVHLEVTYAECALIGRSQWEDTCRCLLDAHYYYQWALGAHSVLGTDHECAPSVRLVLLYPLQLLRHQQPRYSWRYTRPLLPSRVTVVAHALYLISSDNSPMTA